MNVFAIEEFAAQRVADHLREAEHERLVHEARAASPRDSRPRAWNIGVLRRLAGSVRATLFAGAPIAQPTAPLPPSRD